MEVVVSGCFLDGEDAKADSYGLQVGKVDGVWLWWVIGKVAPGVQGFARDFIGLAGWAECKVVSVVEAACIPVNMWRFVKPWGGVLEDSVKCGLGSQRDGDVDGKVRLAYWGVRRAVISECGIYEANVGNHFIVSNSVRPLGGGEIKDLSNPDFLSKLADWCVERGEPRR